MRSPDCVLELELREVAQCVQYLLLSPCCRKMLKLCGETQDRLAQELILFEFTIERDVIEPLYDLAEVNINALDRKCFILTRSQIMRRRRSG